MDKISKYWLKIKENIELLYLNKEISENYTYEQFCNDFIPSDEPLEQPIQNECLCGHDIIYNYTYENDKDTFILGSCCIKTFSSFYRNKRSCIDCNIKIKKNKDNRCPECRKIDKCKCKGCGYIKKDTKYKYCYLCFNKRSR